jgi:hypothetical protein
MASRSGKYVVVGALTITYGLVLCVFWAWSLSAGGAEWLRVGKPGEALATLLFALVPVMLLVTGGALCSWRADALLRARATAAVTAVTGALLAAKAVLACHWAIEHLHVTGFLDVIDHFTGVVLVAVVVVPSAAWALVLTGTAAWVSGDGASARRRLVAFGGLGLLLIAVLVGSWAYWRPTTATGSNLAGLEGTWRDRPDSRHTYQFRANGDVDAWYGSLPMGRFMTWQRDGQRVTARTERNWDFVGELGEGEIRGKMMIRDQTGAVVTTTDAVWRRQ